ncbi:MAG TPA: tRNA glutamyl-Q(34) synthetase GluQRS [Gammaproteobacteria bacterium]|nr:tRNA glutamyl-Q(34) synthetase GluQRS [Gammaproteobacteria bacterium]
MTYVGRFAPSPTGPLHIGSLTTAVASFLHAKQASGEWLVRIEDIDPPREVPGAADQILRTLEAFELPWDRSVAYQSRRIAIYRETADSLLRSGHAFRCSCTRSVLRAAGKSGAARYPGTCRNKVRHKRATAVRARVEPGEHTYVDGLQGLQTSDLHATLGDYVIFRRDDLPAYHLAVVVDDAAQGVTTVVRGIDLLQSTTAHLHLQKTLAVPTPAYFHLPVVTNASGQKLSKQTMAKPVDIAARGAIAVRVLEYLGLAVPEGLRGTSPGMLWEWALCNWRIAALSGKAELPELELVDLQKVD